MRTETDRRTDTNTEKQRMTRAERKSRRNREETARKGEECICIMISGLHSGCDVIVQIPEDDRIIWWWIRATLDANHGQQVYMLGCLETETYSVHSSRMQNFTPRKRRFELTEHWCHSSVSGLWRNWKFRCRAMHDRLTSLTRHRPKTVCQVVGLEKGPKHTNRWIGVFMLYIAWKEDFLENVHVLHSFIQLKHILLISCVFWIRLSMFEVQKERNPVIKIGLGFFPCNSWHKLCIV